ncbi:hypothetical protein PUN28_000476 [Cardiocondyla obscurior]|uniref:Uncharacterized protein n=1 Tax=Cardiocondyla obscurior TaxID=286306 RepID=A0AAW2GZN0_9HYME
MSKRCTLYIKDKTENVHLINCRKQTLSKSSFDGRDYRQRGFPPTRSRLRNETKQKHDHITTNTLSVKEFNSPHKKTFFLMLKIQLIIFSHDETFSRSSKKQNYRPVFMRGKIIIDTPFN